MSRTFDDEREQAYERKLALDQELAFKVAARRNALLARWAAARMQLDQRESDAYVAELVEAGALHDDPGAIVTRIMRDFLRRGAPIARPEVQSQLQTCTARARAEVVRGSLRQT